MVTKALKILDEAREKEESLSSYRKYEKLPKAIKSWLGGWPDVTKIEDSLRASQMYYTCPREFTLNYWQPKKLTADTWLSLLRMTMGTFVHGYLQDKVLGPMGILYGDWCKVVKSGEHEKVVRGFHPDPELALSEIQSRKYMTWVYREDKVFEDHHRISGHLDGYVDIGRIQWLSENEDLMKKDSKKAFKEITKIPKSDMCLLEIKTTSSFIFGSLDDSSKIADYYKMQACVYQKLSDNPRTLFWFISRDSMASRLLLYGYEKGWWRETKRKASIVWNSIRDETLPESMMKCKTPSEDRAKKCVVREECWDRHFGMKKFIEKCKEDQPDREWLDLSNWKEVDD